MQYTTKLVVDEFTLYKYHVSFLNIIHKFSLTRQQQHILIEMLHQNNKYKDVPKDIRSDMVLLNTEVRKGICTKLSIDQGTLNNNISQLRQIKGLQGAVIIGKELNPAYIVYPDKTNYIAFQLTLRDNVVKADSTE